jgi:hypothetical protein
MRLENPDYYNNDEDGEQGRTEEFTVIPVVRLRVMLFMLFNGIAIALGREGLSLSQSFTISFLICYIFAALIYWP